MEKFQNQTIQTENDQLGMSADKQYSVQTMNINGPHSTVTTQKVIVNNYYGDHYLEQARRKEMVEKALDLCDEGKRLYLFIRDVDMTKWCIEYLKIVREPLQMAQIAAELVYRGVMTEEKVITKEFIECLRELCHCSATIDKGLTVDNIRKHIHNCLDDAKG